VEAEARSLDALVTAVEGSDTGLTPAAAVGLDPETLRAIAASPAATFDLDAVAAWFAHDDRPATVEEPDDIRADVRQGRSRPSPIGR